MNIETDVLVVGAGPAGSTAAIAIKKYNPCLSVTLVDKAKFPRDKVCGDGLGPGVVRVLNDLEASHILDGRWKPNSVFVGGPKGYEGFAKGPKIAGRDLSGYVVPRLTFDNDLLELAKARGVSIVEECSFKSMEEVPSGWSVEFKAKGNDSDQVRINTRFVVAADGAYSKVRRALGVEPQPKKTTHVASRVYAEVSGSDAGDVPVNDALRIDFESDLLPAYGWLFPISATRANIGVGLPVELNRESHLTLEQRLDDYYKALERRGIKVLNPEDMGSHQLPHAGHLPKLGHRNAVLIGDAGSMINSLSGEGIAYGMKAGEILGRLLGQEGAIDDPTVPARFEKEFRKRFRSHFYSCWTSHRLLRSPRWAAMVIKAAAQDQNVMADASQMLFDEQRMKFGTSIRILTKGL